MDKKIIKKIYDELIILKQQVIENLEEKTENKSLRNLKAYLNLRAMDVTKLQNELTSIGLSSLGRSQSCLISSINQNIDILSSILNIEFVKTKIDLDALTFEDAQEIMIRKSDVFGQHLNQFKTKVMVTLPSEAKESPKLIKDLIANGTSVFRINTAHDDADTWNIMAKFIKQESELQNKDIKIYVDLAGPKNRTTQIQKVFIPFRIGSWRDPKLVEILPKSSTNAMTKKGIKDNQGNLKSSLVVSDDFFKVCKKSLRLKIDDFERDTKQIYSLIKQDDRIFINCDKKITIEENTNIEIKNENHKYISALYNFEKLPQVIKVNLGDKIIITHQDIIGCSDYKYKETIYKCIIGCTNKDIFPYVKISDSIFIDDGKIGCKVIDINELGLECEIFLAKETGTALKEEKGINFPNTDLQISAITPTDEQNFEYIAQFADIIGLSFAQNKEDIKKLQDMLTLKNKTNIAIAPKIETKTALRNLPTILEQLLLWENYALMIARGDLAIEIGFDNLPYVQEEIFGICEAAHIPVIYATQILEGKMKNNLPSRAEVTDAAFAQRADCVMLNKGPFVIDTVIAIKNILRKVHTQHQKNRQLLGVCETWKCN